MKTLVSRRSGLRQTSPRQALQRQSLSLRSFGARVHLFPRATFAALAVLLAVLPFAQAEETPERQLQDAAGAGNYGEVKRLLDVGVDIDTRKASGATPLYYATLEKREDVALLLIERGAAVDGRGGPKNDTPLMNAASFNELSVIRALLRRGARTDLRCEHGMTAREHAIRNHHPDAGKLLSNSTPK